MADLHLNLGLTLDIRMADFKNDPEKMKEVNKFLDDLCSKAVKEAEIRRTSEQKNKIDSAGIQSKYTYLTLDSYIYFS
ncbi:hypothetical protein HHI36_013027 [Cryptolaemus montrouzieri]|uniref:Uncharacterized protein n=1 Tax=Cryptolaemus montrouzieri TaxID=559131 RepID=A0ABD2NG53_9CUCU